MREREREREREQVLETWREGFLEDRLSEHQGRFGPQYVLPQCRPTSNKKEGRGHIGIGSPGAPECCQIACVRYLFIYLFYFRHVVQVFIIIVILLIV